MKNSDRFLCTVPKRMGVGKHSPHIWILPVNFPECFSGRPYVTADLKFIFICTRDIIIYPWNKNMVRVKESIVTIHTWTTEKNQSVKGLEFWKSYQHISTPSGGKKLDSPMLCMCICVQHRQKRATHTYSKGQQMAEWKVIPSCSKERNCDQDADSDSMWETNPPELLNKRGGNFIRALWIPFMGTMVCFLQWPWNYIYSYKDSLKISISKWLLSWK